MDISGLVHRVCWEPAASAKQELVFDTVIFLVPGDDETFNKGLISAYQEQLVSEGYETVVLSIVADAEAYLSGRTIFVHIPSTPETRDSVYQAVSQSCSRLVEVAKLLQTRQHSRKTPISKLFSLVVRDDTIGGLVKGPLFGLGRVLKMEIPDIFGGVFETDRVLFPTLAIRSVKCFEIVRICDGTAQTALLQPFLDKPAVMTSPSPLQLNPNGTYIITGGTRGVGLEVATWLVQRGGRNLVLISRRGIPSPTSQGSVEQDGGSESERLLSRIEGFKSLGVTVHVLAADLSKSGAASELSRSIDRLALPSVKGVIHAAGIAGYHSLKRCSPTDMAEVLAPKVVGALTLDSLFPPGSLDFFVLISSVGQLVGFEGQLCYGPANAFLDQLAAYRRRQGDNSTSILWSCWRGVGLNAQNKSSMRMISRGMQERGLSDISQDEAFEAWDYISSLKTDHAVVVRAIELDANEPPRHPMLRGITPRQPSFNEYPEHAVAVVGFACQTAAGETAEDLWQVLSEGKSMVRELPLERFPEAAMKPRMWANLMSNVDSFDHQFFKKTKREAAALDPHQRLLLQTTYHALESAGWVSEDPEESELNEGGHGHDHGHTTGCFMGMNATDWPLNLASNTASPYTGGGMLRSFVAGRLSHHFGWTGPSHTIDTACSSAMVAVHQACRSLQLGECTRAIAGGANLITNLALFDALHTGGFLSKTGACKTFDSAADGYCRGEAVGVVVLKPLTVALADKDDIQGVILATGNNQNMNTTSITNPVLESQAALYRHALKRAGIDPKAVSYVEAHGTGTRAGDPVEMGAIRQVLGRNDRATTLHVGSLKANIGHSEGASGVISLIKVLLMMRHKKITPQAHFSTLNSNIQPLTPDGLAISTSLQDWSDAMRLALVNSYGASGNNAVAVVAPPPPSTVLRTGSKDSASAIQEQTLPIIISACSSVSLSSYLKKLKDQIQHRSLTSPLHDLAFTLATRRSRKHRYLFCTTAKSSRELQAQLSNPEKYSSIAQHPKPVVLLFSGQNGSTVLPAQALYDNSALFRKHLDECNEAIRLLNLPSLFPAVLEGLDGDSDLILRHAAMFAIQYSSGMSWLESGLKLQAVCGHSFGEWAAATVSGIMTLKEGMRLVTGRASIIKRLWGQDTGAMVAVEAELVKMKKTPEQHLEPFYEKNPQTKLSVACYNGPNHYVVAGSTPDVEVLESFLRDRKSAGEILRFKVLKGMHAYHSAMADPILEESAKLSATIRFKSAILPFESCHLGTWSKPGSNVVASNTRGAVYFTQAMERIYSRLGPSIFLEAGFGGPIIAMARNAMPQPQTQDHGPNVFVPIDGKDPARSLAEATTMLWKNGISDVQFWPFHKIQRADYSAAVLPPYQFEKNRHWLDYAPSLEADSLAAAAAPSTCPHCNLASDFPYIVLAERGKGKHTAKFKVDPRSRRYQEIVQGHTVVGSPICPAAMYLELAALAVASLTTRRDLDMSVQSLTIKAPLGLDTEPSISLAVINRSDAEWDFELSSTRKDGKPTLHAVGSVVLRSRNAHGHDNNDNRWARITQLLDQESEADALRGAMVYKLFSAMASYSAEYRGLRHLAGKGGEAAGDIMIPKCSLDPATRTPNDAIADPFVIDTFLQVPGIFLHSLHDFGDNNSEEEPGSISYICTGMGSVGPMNWRSPSHGQFRVHAQIVCENQRNVVVDVFVLDKYSTRAVWSAKALQFTRVPRVSLARSLAEANSNILSSEQQQSNEPSRKHPTPSIQTSNLGHQPQHNPDPRVDYIDPLLTGVREVLASCLGIEVQEITRQATLDDLGADSLVGPEIAAKLSSHFNVEISMGDFVKATDVASLCALVSSMISVGCHDGDLGSTSEALDTGNDAADMIRKILRNSLGLGADDVQPNSKLEDIGVDSLVSVEIIGNLNEAFCTNITSSEFASATDVASVYHLVSRSLGASWPSSTSRELSTPGTPISTPRDEKGLMTSNSSNSLHDAFLQVRGDFDVHSNDTKLTGYWDLVYPQQLKVVVAFIVEGFEKLGCPIWRYEEGEALPALASTLPKYQKEVARLWDILEEAGVVVKTDNAFMRGPASPVKIDSDSDSNSGIKSAQELSGELMAAFPQFASAHGLADLLGPYLAECLTGQADPIALLFGSDAGRALLEDFYANGPDLRAATQLLCDFIAAAIRIQAAASSDEQPFRVLEVGAGTGGTTRHLVPLLQATGLPFTYTFTDVSASLVARAKKSSLLGDVPEVDYRRLDIEEAPPADLVGRYHVVVSSNCVHATRNLGSSLMHIRQLLRPRDGCLALVELTQKLAWYDLVWGLLDGWWLFDDGRTYALQSPWAWEHCMLDAGFSHVDWSEGASRESRSVHVLCGLVAELDQPCPVRATSMLLTTPAPALPLERSCNVFLVPDGSGSGTIFNPLAPLLSTMGHVSVFALNSPFIRNVAAADLDLDLKYSPTVEQQAAIYVAELKRRRPEGPYLLAGYSVGGIMAYEMARQLLEQGDVVDKILLIDTACPTHGTVLPSFLVDYLDHHFIVTHEGKKHNGPIFTSHHFALARRQLAIYRPTRLPGPSIPRFVLFSARHGVRKQTQPLQPECFPDEKCIVQWFLDERPECGSLGWEEFLGTSITVVSVDGDHFSIMTEPSIKEWGVRLTALLE